MSLNCKKLQKYVNRLNTCILFSTKCEMTGSKKPMILRDRAGTTVALFIYESDPPKAIVDGGVKR